MPRSRRGPSLLRGEILPIPNADDDETGLSRTTSPQVPAPGDVLVFAAGGVMDGGGVRLGEPRRTPVFTRALCSKPGWVGHDRMRHDWDLIMRATDLGVSSRPCREQDVPAVRRSVALMGRLFDRVGIGFCAAAGMALRGEASS